MLIAAVMGIIAMAATAGARVALHTSAQTAHYMDVCLPEKFLQAFEFSNKN